jgi:hypothetical protein
VVYIWRDTGFTGDITMKYTTVRNTIIALVLLVLFLTASREDYAMAVQSGNEWCENIESGLWYASDDEYKQRCGEK